MLPRASMIVLIQIWYQIKFPGTQKKRTGAFPGSPVVKTSPSNAEGVGSIPGRLRSHMPHSQKMKT